MFAAVSDFLRARRCGLSMAEYHRFQRFFDSKFYLENNPDLYYATIDPESHYCQFGWREGRNPSHGFHTIWYLSAYDDAAESGLNPLHHYARLGHVDDRATSPPEGGATEWLSKAAVNMRLPAQLRAHVRDLLSRARTATTSPIDQASDAFPSSEANNSAPKDVISRLAPIAEAIDDFPPSCDSQNRAGPFVSSLEGAPVDLGGPLARSFPWSLDNAGTDVILRAISTVDEAYTSKSLHDTPPCETLRGADLAVAIILRGFDPAFYRKANPHVDFSAISPLEHYATTGWREGRDPSADFSTNGYLQRYADVRAADVNPLFHFAVYGKAEGRVCLPMQREVMPVDGICEWTDYKDVSSLATNTLEGFEKDIAIVDFTVALGGEALEEVVARLNFASLASENILISIIIPCLNCELYTIECLQSIVNALPKAFAIEVIVADNASEDRAYLAIARNSAIRCIRLDKNEGFGPACNAAARKALGKYFFFLNNDAQIAPGCLEALVAAADYDLVGVVGPKLVSFDGSLQEAGCVLNQDGTGTLIGFGRDPRTARYNYSRPVEHVLGAAMLIARDLFFRLGGFDDVYAPAYCEDADLSLKVRKSGLLVMYEPKALVAHHLSATSNATFAAGRTKRQCISRNRHELVKRWGRDLGERNLRSIAFYLPQYHPIPENNIWWGKGFTEWSNVTKARPNYVGHNQPRFPADLGYYDLRVPSVMEEQAALARRYGITGFCYFYYWFDGKRMLHDPLERMLSTGKPELPFCLCWANENWTRRWDGQKSEVLLRQSYSEGSALGVIADLSRYMKNPLYIKIDGKPLVLIYRVKSFQIQSAQ